MGREERHSYGWLIILLSSIAGLGAVEAILLEISLGFFTSGYGGAYVETLPQIGLFVVASVLCDAFILLAVWTVIIPLLRAVRVPALYVLPVTALLALALPVSLDVARHVAEMVLGRIVSVASLWELAGRSVIEMVAQSLDQLPALGWFAILAALGAAAGVGLVRLLVRLRLVEVGVEPPRTTRLALGTLASGALGTALLASSSPILDPIHFALPRKPSALLLRWIGDRATDFDRDGAGWLARPRDPAPFDASRHPFALEVPGNGVDENGLAGDLPRGSRVPVPHPVPVTARAGGPELVLLLFLESFRGDLLGRRFQGRPVTPFLNQLAQEGARSERAYAHTPLTAESRSQLFQGRVRTRAGAPNLIDDFRARGYEIAHFSGQDDSFARSEQILGLRRADHFYDARDDVGLRAGRGASAGALQVSWQLVVRRLGEYLSQRPRGRPLFLYVNLVDTHFPYHQREMERIFEIDPVGRHEIRPARRDDVLATYLNAAANVDRGVEAVIGLVRGYASEPPAIVVTADHGEAIYEDGLLGHGRRLDDAGTRVPLVLHGIGGDWPEPIGLADLRGLLQEHLAAGRSESGAAPRARFVPDPARAILQCMPRLRRPRLIGLRELSGAVQYDLVTDRLEVLASGDGGSGVEPEALRIELIRSWEALRLAEEGLPATADR